MPIPSSQLLPAWLQHKDMNVGAAHIRQGSLELMQWIAFAAMVLDHISHFMPAFGGEEIWLFRYIGRIALPLFMLVFAWRLARVTWIDPDRSLTPMAFRLFICSIFAHLFFVMAGFQKNLPLNIVVSFLCLVAIVSLLREDLPTDLYIPLGLRWLAASLIGFWVHQEVDYGINGLLLGLGIYSFMRYGEEAGRNVALAALALLTLTIHIHAAFVALPLAWVIHAGGWEVRRSIPNLFYWLYPIHILFFAIAIHWS